MPWNIVRLINGQEQINGQQKPDGHGENGQHAKGNRCRLKLVSINGTAHLKKIVQSHSNHPHTQQHQRDADQGRKVITRGDRRLRVNAELAQKETEARHDEPEGNGCQTGAYPGQESAFIGQVISHPLVGMVWLVLSVLRVVMWDQRVFWWHSGCVFLS